MQNPPKGLIWYLRTPPLVPLKSLYSSWLDRVINRNAIVFCDKTEKVDRGAGLDLDRLDFSLSPTLIHPNVGTSKIVWVNHSV